MRLGKQQLGNTGLSQNYELTCHPAEVPRPKQCFRYCERHVLVLSIAILCILKEINALFFFEQITFSMAFIKQSEG